MRRTRRARSADHVYAGTITTTAPGANPALVMPQVDFNYWWANAMPGPKHPCTVSTGTVPAFDNDAGSTNGPNDSIPVNGEMTPNNADYDCQVWVDGVLKGELGWNHTTHVMTILGTIFIDGNFRFDDDGEIVHYQGTADIMSGGYDEIDEVVCAGGSGTAEPADDCISTGMANWDATQNYMTLMSMKDNEYDQGGSGCAGSPPACLERAPAGGLPGRPLLPGRLPDPPGLPGQRPRDLQHDHDPARGDGRPDLLHVPVPGEPDRRAEVQRHLDRDQLRARPGLAVGRLGRLTQSRVFPSRPFCPMRTLVQALRRHLSMLRFRSERGIALVMALGLLTVLTISGTAVTYYATTNLTDSSSHKARASAYDLAEAGINDAIATMSNQLDSNGALKTTAGTWKKPTDPTLLSTPVTVAYPSLNGSVTYSGALMISGTNYTWRITSTGKVKSGNTGYQDRTLYKSVKVLGTNAAGGSSWSRFYDDSTSQCLNIDNQTFVTNVATRGNLCLTNGGAITGAGVTVDVGGTVTITGPDATSPTRPPALGAGWPTTPTNIYTSNSAYAQNTIAAVATGSNLDATNFGLTVPATAVVEGITATVQRLASACCNAVQTITETGSPTGGTFKLNATPAGGSSTVTAAIAYNASAATVQTALVTIFGSGNVTCTGGSLPAPASSARSRARTGTSRSC